MKFPRVEQGDACGIAIMQLSVNEAGQGKLRSSFLSLGKLWLQQQPPLFLHMGASTRHHRSFMHKRDQATSADGTLMPIDAAAKAEVETQTGPEGGCLPWLLRLVMNQISVKN